MTKRDSKYLNILVNKIRVCNSYKPKFGYGSVGYNLTDFQSLYGADPFYAWLGLDSPLMYAAHKAAGSMTSIYRQIGIGCEELFRQIIMDSLTLSKEDVSWSYSVSRGKGKMRTLSLDARISIASISDNIKRNRAQTWLNTAAEHLNINHAVRASLQGVVFEIRQGYKSKDSKRQNADIANAATAHTQGYIPCLAVLSSQIDESIAFRYQAEQWLLLTGIPRQNSSTQSLYAFAKEILEFDLAAFFERNSSVLQHEIHTVLQTLLSAEGGEKA
jgi:hypothetical protein